MFDKLVIDSIINLTYVSSHFLDFPILRDDNFFFFDYVDFVDFVKLVIDSIIDFNCVFRHLLDFTILQDERFKFFLYTLLFSIYL